MTAAFGKRGAPTSRTARPAHLAAVSKQPRDTKAAVAPARSLTSRLKGLAASLFMLALAAGIAITYGGGIVRDFTHGNAYAVDLAIKVAEAKCKSKGFAFTFCDVELAATTPSGMVREKIYFVVLFASLGDERVVPLRSTVDPSVLSTQSAYDRRYNRVITLFLLTAILLSLALIVAINGFSERERR